MPRRTREEYEAAAMLAGMGYDFHNHTFIFYGPRLEFYCPDTLEFLVSEDDYNCWEVILHRRHEIAAGRLPPEVTYETNT